jgi:hypothetical protein
MAGAVPVTEQYGGESSVPSDWLSPDGLIEQVWQHMAAILAAASRADGNDFARLLRRFDADSSDDERADASAYLWFILRFRVAEMVGHRPTAEDLHDLADKTYPEYAKIISEPMITLEDTLRFFWKMTSAGSQLSGGRLFVSAAAAAGILLHDPRTDLESIRPRVAKWKARGTADS